MDGLQQAIAGLPEKQREAVVLRDLYGLAKLTGGPAAVKAVAGVAAAIAASSVAVVGVERAGQQRPPHVEHAAQPQARLASAGDPRGNVESADRADDPDEPSGSGTSRAGGASEDSGWREVLAVETSHSRSGSSDDEDEIEDRDGGSEDQGSSHDEAEEHDGQDEPDEPDEPHEPAEDGEDDHELGDDPAPAPA